MIFWKYVYEGDLLVEKYKMKQTSLRHIYLILASMLIYFCTISLIVNPSASSYQVMWPNQGNQVQNGRSRGFKEPGKRGSGAPILAE